MASAFSSGTMVGRYVIEAEVGRGGMGVVYRALDPALNRAVALKVLAQHLDHEQSARLRFHREANAIANLKHPHIALVYEFGEHAGLPFIALEWVEGRTLKDLLSETSPLPLERALDIFDQLAEALDYAHARGVIHRDLKPANIIVNSDGRATLVDFGLATMQSAPALTASGMVFGTPLYISPEQIRGDEIDGRSDLYSLGIVAYEMLAGKLPFEGNSTPALLHHHLYTPPLPITEHNPALPLQIESALQKALSKNRADRFPSAREFALALRQGVDATGAPIGMGVASREMAAPASQSGTQSPFAPAPQPATPAIAESPVTVAAPITPRRRWAVPLTITAAVLIVICLLAAFALNSFNPIDSVAQVTLTARMAETLTMEATLTAGTLTASALTAPSTETATEAPTAEPTAAETATQEPTLPPTLIPTPANIPPREGGWWPMAQGDAVRSGFVSEPLTALNAAPKWNRFVPPGGVTAMVVGGGLVFFGTQDGALHAREWDTGLKGLRGGWDSAPLGAAGPGEFVGEPALYYADEATFRIVVTLATQEIVGLDAWTGAEVWRLSSVGTAFGGVTIGGDGWAYAATDAGWLYVISPGDGALANAFDLSGTDAFYSPPSVWNSVAYLSGSNQAVYAIDVSTGGVLWTGEVLGQPSTAPSVAPDLGRLFVGTNDGHVHALWLETGDQAWPPQRASSSVVGLAHDGVRLYAVSQDGQVYGWVIEDPNDSWAVNTGVSTLSSAPLTDGSLVLITTPFVDGIPSGDVRYLDAGNGSEVAGMRLSLQDVGYHAPAPAGGWLFVPGWQFYGLNPP